jgi:3',5'-cyclic-AMP phosphodiesterase
MLIAHLSDPHITAGALAAAPAAGLHQALGRVLALAPRPDCVVITGDLADRGRLEEYAVLTDVIGGFPLPIHLVTGNHDRHRALLDVFGGTDLLGGGDSAYYTVDYPQATIVALDSLSEADGDAGRLGPEQLDWLDRALAVRAGRPAFVCLHHPPIPVGIPFMDSIRLLDGEDLAEVVGRHPHVVRVLAGHLHRPVSASFAGSLLTVAPSTYRQVSLTMRDGDAFGYLAEPTGFLLHVLGEAGCVTHSVPVSHAGAVIGGYPPAVAQS